MRVNRPVGGIRGRALQSGYPELLAPVKSFLVIVRVKTRLPVGVGRTGGLRIRSSPRPLQRWPIVHGKLEGLFFFTATASAAFVLFLAADRHRHRRRAGDAIRRRNWPRLLRPATAGNRLNGVGGRVGITRYLPSHSSKRISAWENEKPVLLWDSQGQRRQSWRENLETNFSQASPATSRRHLSSIECVESQERPKRLAHRPVRILYWVKSKSGPRQPLITVKELHDFLAEFKKGWNCK